ncbi:hypothetical protein E4U61_004705 [Claviceps capensis]|nr:hypothetical protein E4U61_004705 [Claviceps capensis]
MVPTPCRQALETQETQESERQQAQKKDQQIQEKDQQIQEKEQELQNGNAQLFANSLDHIEIPLKKILRELKAVSEECVFFAKDVEITFELDTLVVIQKAMWLHCGMLLVSQPEIETSAAVAQPYIDSTKVLLI